MLHKTFSPVPVLSRIVLKDMYVGVDDLNIEKWRSVLQTCFLTLPDHLPVAQSLFGCTAGLGFRCFLSCRLQSRSMNARVITSRQVEQSMELNVVPFAADFLEYVRRGIELKYLECNELLSVVIDFNRVRGMDSLLPHMA